jgi:delta8-fatty-acid desaturase
MCIVTKAESPSVVSTSSPPPKTMTRAEVNKVANPDSLLLIILNDKIYNMTQWQDNHPGGHLTMRALSGKDATDNFAQNHPKYVQKMLPKFLYSELSDFKNGVDEATLAFRELTEKMHDSGLFETRYSFYYFMMARLSLMFGAVLYGVLCSDNLYVHALAGVMLGFFWQQVAFVGHDLGHNGITHTIQGDSRLAFFLANFMTGIGMGWWKRSHNVHHIVTNSVDYDPDIQHLPIFAVSPAFLEKPIFSKFYNATMSLNKAAHVLVGVQHYLYYPVMAFARINLYIQSILHVCGIGAYSLKEKIYRRDLQALTLIGFWCWLSALIFSLPNNTSRLVFFLLSHNVAGILHVQITLSHFSMPSYEGVTYDSSANGFLHTQLEGSMDIDCPLWMDWFHGGLHLQAVHHLWPRLPRHNLRIVQKMLIEFCKQYPHLNYKQYGFIKANKMMLGKLKETSKTAKTFHELFADSINMAG